MEETREHTSSYYAATCDPETNYPLLEGEHRCDVAIVGAGFTGVSAALHLVEKGYDVALIEANRIGWGASGRNGGQLIGGFVDVDKIGKRFGPDAANMARQMRFESREILVQRVEKYSIDCDLKIGYLDVALRDADMQDFAGYIEEKKGANYAHDMRIVPRDEMPEYLGTDHYIGGLADYGNGHLHPLNLCIGEARAAENLGAKVFEQTRVTRIVHGDKPVVETESGHVSASKVVLAGNGYLGDAEPRLRNRIIPAGSYMIATEPLSDDFASELLPADWAFCEQTVGLNYFRLSPDKRLLFGGMCNYSGRDPKSITASLRPKMLKIFPQLKDRRIDYEWGGIIAISVNRIPQFGRIEGNTYYAQGYSGHGVAPTHLAGKMLADAVAGDSEQFDVFSKVRHLWLPGGKWFANPVMALGMMYYRLKELL